MDYGIYNKKCEELMEEMIEKDIKIDLILTSPPYNTSRKIKGGNKENQIKNHWRRYDEYIDSLSDSEYIDWILSIFEKFNLILRDNGVILYNISYSSENPDFMYKFISELINKSEFTIADTIYWKKKSALPNNVSSNKITRIVEPVFVICRKSEIKTFKMNKQVKSISKKGQKFYENLFNYVEARNNDGTTNLNKATYSSELCEKLLQMYAIEGSVVYDPFLGTGTTGVSCERLNLNWYGSEISKAQCEYAEERLKIERDKNGGNINEYK